MLKLTHSFCRYLKVACESNSSIHVRTFTNFSCEGTKCTKEGIPSAPTSPVVNLKQPCLASAHLQKFSINEVLPQSNEQMSESWQPTMHHVSYGGHFQVTHSIDSSDEELLSHFEDNGTPLQDKPPSFIPPDFRVWEPISKHSDTNDSFQFKVVSYNVLAQYLLQCHPYLYRDCSPRNLKWKNRASRLYDEIVQLAPDILCLQEVQVSHLNSFYSKFENLGYTGIFKQKTGHRQDGCAIYFKSSVFRMEDQMNVEFYQPALPILNRDNIGIMVKLVPRSLPDSPLVVATTHLLYNPSRTDVRLAQMQVFLAEIDRFAYHSNGRDSRHLPIILTGDFNSTPDSAVVKLLSSGHVKARSYRDSSDWRRVGVTDHCQHLAVYLNRQAGRHTDFSMIQIYNSDHSVRSPSDESKVEGTEAHCDLFNSGVVQHTLKLGSVYSCCKADGQREATTFQDYWLTVDYMYFSCCRSLKLLERLRLPTASECEVLGCLPNDVYGSDHLCLGALFELKPYTSSL